MKNAIVMVILAACAAAMLAGCSQMTEQDMAKMERGADTITKTMAQGGVQGMAVLRGSLGGHLTTKTTAGADLDYLIVAAANPPAAYSGVAADPALYRVLLEVAMDRGYMPRNFVEVALANDVKLSSGPRAIGGNANSRNGGE